jgi:adenine-specific DNA-methyltransferase
MAIQELRADLATIGDEYAASHGRDHRRQVGLVYTPNHIVRFALRRAGFRVGRTAGRTLLDPACGAGAFLRAAADILLANLAKDGVEVRTSAGRERMLRLLETTLFGMDIDSSAVTLARQGMRNFAAEASQAAVPESFFTRNVVCADFVLGDAVADITPSNGFSFIAGNPPYVPADRLAPGLKDRLRVRYVSARGRLDLYTVFIERAVELLSIKGRLAFVTPDKFLGSQTSQPLRRLLSQKGAVVALARFRSHRVFMGAATVPSVLVYEKGRRSKSFVFFECGAQPDRGAVRVVSRSKVASAALTEVSWTVHAPTLERIARDILASHAVLRSCTARLSAGVATGLDSLYVVSEDSPIEPELLRAAVRGRDIGAYHIADPALRLLVPYAFSSAGPQLVDLNRFPLAARYLSGRRADLEKRHCVRTWRKVWWDLHDPVPCDIGALGKILVPDIASHNRFAFDSGRFWPLHSAYYVVPRGINPFYLTAVLNSRPVEFLIRLRAPLVKDGFSRYRKQFLLDLPIPRPGENYEARIGELAASGATEEAAVAVEALLGFKGSMVGSVEEFLLGMRKAIHE